MKKQMQTKKNYFYVAMAAFVLLVAGCTKDIVEGSDEPDPGQETKGEKVYMSVNIATPSGGMTKAGDSDPKPAGGEDGDGPLTGSDVENAIHDVWIYLVPTETNYSALTSNDLTLVQSTTEDVTIIGTYTEQIGGSSGSGIPNHRPAVMVSFSTDKVEYGKYYQVLTIVNGGKDLQKFTKLDQLRNYLQEKAWMDGDGTNGNTKKFVMTTHQMWQSDGNPKGSDIKFEATNTKDNPAVTTAYVERLAARIDLKVAEGLLSATGDGKKVENPVKPDGEITPATGGNPTTIDYVKLTGYTVINRMQAGSYMLKRVTSDVSGENLGFNDATEKDKYLEDEVWNTPSGSYNYVVDPWTGSKTSDDATNFSTESFLSENNVYNPTTKASVSKTYEELYINPFISSLNGNTSLFKEMTGISGDEFTPIQYTQENTMDIAQQKNGFTTGLIFRAVYKPGSWSVYDPEKGAVEVQALGDDDKDFYVVDGVYNSGGSRYLCKDLTTAGVVSFKTATDSQELIQYLFDEAGGTQTWPTGISSVEEMKTIVGKIKGGKLAQAYQAYLNDKLTDGATWDETLQASLKWSAFCGANNIDASTSQATLAETYGVSYYKGGECYYKFWIRHANNGNPNVMGVMEFAMVRNNVYQLEVTGVGALGDPLPFTPGKDDPDTPDEESEVAINVKIYVKDWVLRTNSGIIL